MGQYYKPICVDTGEWVYSHDYGAGLKLMEHSYIENHLVRAVMTLLAPGGGWHKKRIVWAGDYGEKGFKDFENDDMIKKFAAELDSDSNLYGSVDDGAKLNPTPIRMAAKKLIVNHTQKEYVDLRKVRANKDGWAVHPLPILTADGNGQGGGDYNGTCMEQVGCWAGDVISVETKVPKGYKELMIDFMED